MENLCVLDPLILLGSSCGLQYVLAKLQIRLSLLRRSMRCEIFDAAWDSDRITAFRLLFRKFRLFLCDGGNTGELEMGEPGRKKFSKSEPS